MTTVIGDEDNGWSSATMQNGELVQNAIQRLKPRKVEFDEHKVNSAYACQDPVMPSMRDLEEESNVLTSITASSPKTRDSSHKIPVNLCPASAIIAIALVISQGHKKPGRSIFNWRKQPISYLDYHAAALRHLLRSIDGHNYDSELSQLASGGYFNEQGKIVGGDRDNNGDFVIQVRHDWAAMSCLAIIEDARQSGTLVDDRPVKGGAEEFLESLMVKK
jgi:hypothetical protein